MGRNVIIVREYLASLKEDTELDRLFPLLLHLMGFKIITTPKEYKGIPQYGKDVIATKVVDGIKTAFYFELKGYADKDIDDDVLMKSDGIFQSFMAAKLTKFKDTSIDDFDKLPKMFVLVHNGILQPNTRPNLQGFIDQWFPEGNFKRWDIYELAELFSGYLFDEFLLTDDESIRLFKRTLVLLDAPNSDYSDFYSLLEIQISKVKDIKGRSFRKFFSTINLLSTVLIHYSRENNNLNPAKLLVTKTVLRVWSWVLSNGLSKKKGVRKAFQSLLDIHTAFLHEYFEKTLHYVSQSEGFYIDRGGPFETIGAPMRSLEYLSYLIYHFEHLEYVERAKGLTDDYSRLRRGHKDILIKLIEVNGSTKKVLLDRHSIPVVQLVLYFINEDDFTEGDLRFVGTYLIEIIDRMAITSTLRDRFPEFRNNLTALSDFVATGVRPPEYSDKSSLLINTVFEMLSIFNAQEFYEQFRVAFAGKVNLQVTDCQLTDGEFELALFEGNMNDHYINDVDCSLPDDYGEFVQRIVDDKRVAKEYLTDAAELPFLRTLAHFYYNNEFLPNTWRQHVRLPRTY
jgi:hypothetical protein